MIMKKIEIKKIPELVIDSFFEALDRGDIKLGQQLLSERELSEKLEISRGTLREGLSILEFLGIISSKGNNKVVQKDYKSIESILKFYKLTDKDNIVKDFLEFRSLIEKLNIQLACEKGTSEDFSKLNTILIQIKEGVDITKVDYNLHMSLAKLTKNEFLISITEVLLAMVQELRPKLQQYPGRKQYIEDEWNQIIDAIKSNNCKKAKDIMEGHLFFIEKTLMVINSIDG